MGSQIVGIVPLDSLLMAAEYYMKKENLFILEEDQKLRLVRIFFSFIIILKIFLYLYNNILNKILSSCDPSGKNQKENPIQLSKSVYMKSSMNSSLICNTIKLIVF